jgi:broad specificity phosphatase PhoE
MAGELWVVRHGETEWSKAGQHTSRTDLPLTDHGREQACEAAGALAGVGFSLVLCSPLLRARETCRLLGFEQAAELCDDLREWDYGDYEGLTTAQIRESRPGWTVWGDGCPGGESATDVGARADRVIALVRGVDGDVAVFAHGHFLRVLGARWCGLEPEAGAVLALDTATLCRLGWEREQAVVRMWNAPVS